MGKTYQAKRRKLNATVIGGKEIAKRLKSMEDEASSVLEKAVMTGGKIALDESIRNCPVDTGALRNSLKIEQGKATNTRAEIKIDYDKSLKYGTFVELGANGREPRPFLRNAVDENEDKINNAITKSLAKAVLKKW